MRLEQINCNINNHNNISNNSTSALLPEEMSPECSQNEEINNGYQLNGQSYSWKFRKTCSASSIDSMDQDAYFSDCPSDDLDKLSMCLSEASLEATDRKKSSSILTDVIQAQLALWTLIISIFYSYAWQQHRKKFLISLFVVIPPVILVCVTLSSLLTTTVILGRVFSSSIRIQDILKRNNAEVDEDQKNLANSMGGSSSGNQLIRRKRSTSMNSCYSSVSNRSSSCEEMPKPVCRKHSTSYGGSMLVCGTPTASANGNFGGSLNNGTTSTYFHHNNNNNGFFFASSGNPQNCPVGCSTSGRQSPVEPSTAPVLTSSLLN